MYPIAIRQRRWPPSSHIPESPSPHASVNNQKRAVERIYYYKVWGSGGLPTNSNIDPGGDPEVESPCCWYSMMLLDAVDAGTQCQYYTLSMPGFYLLNPKRRNSRSSRSFPGGTDWWLPIDSPRLKYPENIPSFPIIAHSSHTSTSLNAMEHTYLEWIHPWRSLLTIHLFWEVDEPLYNNIYNATLLTLHLSRKAFPWFTCIP